MNEKKEEVGRHYESSKQVSEEQLEKIALEIYRLIPSAPQGFPTFQKQVVKIVRGISEPAEATVAREQQPEQTGEAL